MTEPTREQVTGAFDAGKTAGAAGDPPGVACPYEPRTVLCTWWLRGYTLGYSQRSGAPALT